MQCRTVHGAFTSLYRFLIKHTLHLRIFCVSSAISPSLKPKSWSVITSDVLASTHSVQLHLNILSSVSPNRSSTSASTSLYTCCFSLFIIVENTSNRRTPIYNFKVFIIINTKTVSCFDKKFTDNIIWSDSYDERYSYLLVYNSQPIISDQLNKLLNN